MNLNRAAQQAANLAVGVIGIAMVYRIVSPRNNTAAIIDAFNQGMAGMIRVATAEGAIARRSPECWDRMIALAEPEQLELYAGLSDNDLDWVIDQLEMTLDG